jgi:hypothetical protein
VWGAEALLDKAGRLIEEEVSRAAGTDQLPMPPSRYSSRAWRAFAGGYSFYDKDGHKRGGKFGTLVEKNATTFRKAALGMDGRVNEIPDSRLPTDYRYHEGKPVFFGHYWLNDRPEITAPSAACLDFSVAKEGWLTAYLWSDERELAEETLVSVPAWPKSLSPA